VVLQVLYDCYRVWYVKVRPVIGIITCNNCRFDSFSRWRIRGLILADHGESQSDRANRTGGRSSRTYIQATKGLLVSQSWQRSRVNHRANASEFSIQPSWMSILLQVRALYANGRHAPPVDITWGLDCWLDVTLLLTAIPFIFDSWPNKHLPYLKGWSYNQTCRTQTT
jgi:hypothetical protein